MVATPLLSSFKNPLLKEEGDYADEPVEEKPKKSSIYLGLILAAFSSVFFSLSSVIVKYMVDVHPIQLAFYRFLGIFVFNTPSLIYRPQNVFPVGYRTLLLIRSLGGACSLMLRFFAFRYLPIADASVIIFCVPVVVSIFAVIFLKEPCNIIQIITVALTFIGIIIITRIPLVISNSHSYTREEFFGMIAAFTSIFLASSVYICLRKLKDVPHSVVLFNFGLHSMFLTLVLGIIVMKGWDIQPFGFYPYAYFLLLAIFSYFGQVFLTCATKDENAGPVAIVRASFDIILTFIWQVIFFDDHPDAWSISGAVIVSSSIILIYLRKWIGSLPKESPIRRRLYFLSKS